MPFCMYVVGTSVCGLFRDKLRDLRTIIFVLAQSNGVQHGAADFSGIALSRFSKSDVISYKSNTFRTHAIIAARFDDDKRDMYPKAPSTLIILKEYTNKRQGSTGKNRDKDDISMR